MNEDSIIVLPEKKPVTIKDLLDWHIKIFMDCLEAELKKNIIEYSIKDLNERIKETAKYLQEDEHIYAAKLKLKKLNNISNQYKEELCVIKGVIKVLHRTNEAIIG